LLHYFQLRHGFAPSFAPSVTVLLLIRVDPPFKVSDIDHKLFAQPDVWQGAIPKQSADAMHRRTNEFGRVWDIQ
jgi:hypothetical protein